MNGVGSSTLFSSGVYGIQRGSQQLNQVANDVVQSGIAAQQAVDKSADSANKNPAVVKEPSVGEASTYEKTSPRADQSNAVAELSESKVQVQASAKVVESADNMLGAIIDIKA